MYRFLGAVVILGCTTRFPISIDLIEQATKQRFEDANGVILFDSILVEVESDGKAVYYEHKLVKILSIYGKKEFGEVTFHYYTREGILNVNLARVITPEHKVVEVPKDAIKDVPFVPLDEHGAKLFLSDVRMVKIIFPQVEIGSCVEYIVTTKLQNPPMPNRFADIEVFGELEPIIKKVYIVELPKDMSMKYVVRNGTLSFCKEEDLSVGSRSHKLKYKWEANDVPPIIEEPLMPSVLDVATTLIISNIPDWEEVSSWYYTVSDSVCIVDVAIKNKVKELTSTLNTQEEKIRSIFNFISTEIRYLRTEAISKGKGYAPDPTPVTFERKWGVCRDKAALCVAMLKEIGIEAYIGLVDVTYNTAIEIPTPYFEHAIVAIKKDDGSYYYLDPTVEYTMELFPLVEQNRYLLICTKEGKGLNFVPYTNSEGNWLLIQNIGNIDEGGNLSAFLSMKGEGIMDMSLRGLRYVSPEQQKQLFEQIIKSFSPDATLDNFKIGDVTDLATPFTIEIWYMVPEYAIKIDNELHLTSNSSAAFALGGGFAGEMGIPWGLEKRKYPLYFGFPILTKTRSEFSIPNGYKVRELPEDYEARYPKFYGKSSKKEYNSKIILTSEFFIKDPFIKVDEYTDLKSVVEELERHSKKEIVVIKK